MKPGQFFVARDGSAIFGLENFPLNDPFFNFFTFGSKTISLSQVKKSLGQSRVGLLFTAGQKYAQVSLGHLYCIPFPIDHLSFHNVLFELD